MHLGSLEAVTRLWSTPERRLRLLGLVVGLGIIVAVWSLRGRISGVEAVGYPSIFFLSFLGSVALVLPVPGLISVCGLSLSLNPFLIGLVAGVGETLGEISGYAIGYGGGTVIENRRFYPYATLMDGAEGEFLCCSWCPSSPTRSSMSWASLREASASR